MKRKIGVVILMVVFITMIATTIRIIEINARYPGPEETTYSMGETIRNEDIEITILDSRLGELEDFKNGAIFQDSLETFYTFDFRRKVIVLDVLLENKGDTTARADMTQFVLESGSWANGWDLEFFRYLNDADLNMLEIPTNKQQKVKLGFFMYDFQLSQSDWNNIGEKPFYLVMEIYPEKQQVLLDVK
ncbi:MAG: hypothetical protein FWE25_07530 [Lachnospiraceae bacterium]|nr:hypothetical protein [Lachnospiraceae bacterium]